LLINLQQGGIVKVAAIIGSPQGMKGRTGMLVKEILAAAQQAGAETEIY
jgi:multimeric flavodoxin WrbA